MKKREVYTAGFKREAVRLSEQASVSVIQVAQGLGISDYSLYKGRTQACNLFTIESALDRECEIKSPGKYGCT